MISDKIDSFVINFIITNIITVIIIVIVILLLISTFNIIIYTIYNTNSIFKQYVYETSSIFRLKEIYSFMLINYVYILNDQNTLELKLSRDNKKYNIDDTIKLKNKDDIDKIFLYIQDKDSNKTPKKNNIIKLTKNEENLLTNYIKINDNEIMLKADYNDMSNKNYYKYKALYYSDVNFYNSLDITDNYASYLYLHVCNKFYQFISILLFTIIIIILTVFLLEVSVAIFNKIFNKDDDTDDEEDENEDEYYKKNILSYISNEHFYKIVVILVICASIVLHGIVYKKLFIDTLYDGLYKNYKELMEPDTYVRTEISNIYNSINNINRPEIKEMFYDNNINILKNLAKAEYDSIMDSVINKKDTYIIQNETNGRYKDKLLNTNKNFRISNYKLNEHIFKYIEHILNINPSNNYLIGNDNNDYIVSSIFLYIIYSYFINNNSEDPHIINKLNKLLLNEKIIFGDDIVDEDIEYTLLLRSLLPSELDDSKMIGEINAIMRDVLKLYEVNYNSNIIKYSNDIHNKNILLSLLGQKNPSIIKIDIKKKIDGFCELLKLSGNKINFGSHIFILYSYLILEFLINIIAIFLILYFMDYSDMFKGILSYFYKGFIFVILGTDLFGILKRIIFMF